MQQYRFPTRGKSTYFFRGLAIGQRGEAGRTNFECACGISRHGDCDLQSALGEPVCQVEDVQGTVAGKIVVIEKDNP